MISRNARLLMVLAVISLLAAPAFAGKPIKVKAYLAMDCSNCATIVGNFDVGNGTVSPGGKYSIQPKKTDGFDTIGGVLYGIYQNGPNVQSEILTHNAVYTLDTLPSLGSDGLVDSNSRTVEMFFYTSATNTFPVCWGATKNDTTPDVETAVNWSILSDNQLFFTEMLPGVPNPGRHRMDFVVRNGVCDNQVYRYYLKGGNVTITFLGVIAGKRQWEVFSGPSCFSGLNCGEADLFGQGGRRKETLPYGTWRVPFKLLLIEE